MAVRLQHQLHDIAVPKGTFLIGRGSDCALALDDALVSRRHAAIHVEEDGSAVLEDLGSRNGVFVNGVKVEKTEPLNDGDLIRIGGQDICFYRVQEDGRPSSGQRANRVTMQHIPSGEALAEAIAAAQQAAHEDHTLAPRQPVSTLVSAVSPAPEGESPGSGKPISHGLPPTMPNPVVREMRVFDPEEPGEMTAVGGNPFGAGSPARLASGLGIIGSVADKALALGRAEEAERILQRTLQDVLARASIRGEVDLDLAERAATYAVRLAGGTGRGSWIDYVFQLYTILRSLLPARVVDELYAAVRKVKHTDKSVIRAYTTYLRQISVGFGPAERFVHQRIESFERWAP